MLPVDAAPLQSKCTFMRLPKPSATSQDRCTDACLPQRLVLDAKPPPLSCELSHFPRSSLCRSSLLFVSVRRPSVLYGRFICRMDGIRLTRHHAFKVCSPTRSSFHTGRMACVPLTSLTFDFLSPIRASSSYRWNGARGAGWSVSYGLIHTCGACSCKRRYSMGLYDNSPKAVPWIRIVDQA
jgi:hypothetical protein